MDSDTGRPGRREALRQLLRLGGVGAGGAGLAFWLGARSRHPEERASSSFQRRAGIPPDPSLPEMIVAQGEDPRALVRRAVEELGGMRRFVSPGEVVLIKPNIAWDRTPEQAANTNPQVVSEVARLAREAGASKVIVSDISCNEPRRCFRRSGIAEAASAEGAEVLLPEERALKRVNLGRALGSWLVLEPILSADKVINIPVAKHHDLTGVSLGMKNWVGVVGGQRVWLHQDIHASLAELADFVRPALTIIDAYRILARNGPTGGSLSDVELKKTLVASTDPVAADAYAAKAFWNLNAQALRYLRLAQDRGLGNVNIEQVRQKRLTIAD